MSRQRLNDWLKVNVSESLLQLYLWRKLAADARLADIHDQVICLAEFQRELGELVSKMRERSRGTVISLKNCERSDRTLARISSNM